MSDEASQGGMADLDQEAFSRWVKEQVQSMGRHAVDNRLFDTDRVEVRPVWAIPHKAFIGKIWETANAGNAFWIISGVFHADHLPASVAPTAREAARHFSLKWQMQSARLEGNEGDQSADDANWTGIGQNLVQQAEALYALVGEDKVWENVRDDA